MTPSEEWRPVVGCDGYEISSHGRFRGLDRTVHYIDGRTRRYPGMVLALSLDPKGYPKARLGRFGTKHVHVEVMRAFVGPRPDRQPICHGDGNPLNNHLSNLRYDTTSENIRDTVRHGRNYWANKTHCPQHHPYSPENTLVSSGRRYCRTCARERSRKRAS